MTTAIFITSLPLSNCRLIALRAIAYLQHRAKNDRAPILHAVAVGPRPTRRGFCCSGSHATDK